MILDCFTTEVHYADHLLPVWNALTDHERGFWFTGGGGEALAARVKARSPHTCVIATDPPDGEYTTLVASHNDYRYTPRNRPVIYLEHGAGQTYCLAPETRVLTAALEWRPIRDVGVGDELVGFDEDRPGFTKGREWKRAHVTAATSLFQPCYRLHLADGSKVVASARHRWLTRNRDAWHWHDTERLQDVARHGGQASKLYKIMEPWDEDRSWGAGYLAAAFDGEGCLTQTAYEGKGNRLVLAFTQRQNQMLALVERELRERGFQFTKSVPREDDVVHLTVTGGTREILRFVGTIRPRRLLGNFKPLGRGAIRGNGVAVLDREYIGEQEVIGLTTSTGTFVAEGFASHNSGVTHGGYSGGEGRERVVLFLCPNERVVALNCERYPETPAVAVGSPKLDRWHATMTTGAGEKQFPRRSHKPETSGATPVCATKPVVAFSCHWDCSIVPETRTGFWEFSPALPALMERYEVLGHGHPKGLESFRGTYDTLGIEVVDDFDEVLARADCYICDNSSTMYEWCAVADRPIVSLRPSFYRREVEHGLRFWEAEPWPVCESAETLPMIVTGALMPDAPFASERSRCARAAYGNLVDGHASARAVEAIRSVT